MTYPRSLLDSFGWTSPETERVTGWGVVEPGLKIVMDRHIPTIARVCQRTLRRPFLTSAWAERRWSTS